MTKPVAGCCLSDVHDIKSEKLKVKSEKLIVHSEQRTIFLIVLLFYGFDIYRFLFVLVIPHAYRSGRTSLTPVSFLLTPVSCLLTPLSLSLWQAVGRKPPEGREYGY